MAAAPKALPKTANDYKKLSQREHVLLRPQMYIGSSAREQVDEWILNTATHQIEKRSMNVPEAIKRVFYEIISNAADATIESRARGIDPKEIVVLMDDYTVSVQNFGCPIPVVQTADGSKWLPEEQFSDFMSSSNYDTSKQRTGVGLHGLGSKISNTLSKLFCVEIQDHFNKKTYCQTFRDNLEIIDPPIVQPYKGKESSVKITYTLDHAYFGNTQYDQNTKDLFARITFDYGLSLQVPTRFNDLSFPVQTLESMARHYFGEDALQNVITFSGLVDVTVYTTDASGRKNAASARREKAPIEFILLDTPFEGHAISFVNAQMVNGGVHVDALYKAIADQVLPSINQEVNGKAMLSAKDLKQHASVLMVSTLPDPSFKSQVKSQLASPEPTFTFQPNLFTPLKKWQLMDRLKNILDQKESEQLVKTDGKKKRHVNVDGYDTCNWAGTSKSAQCTLCLIEGKSAKAYGIQGRAEVPNGIETIGVYCLRGKLLNVMNAKLADVAKNKEVEGIKNILALREGVDYMDDENFKKLRYGKLCIMTDADNDGKHIAALVMNYFFLFYPSLVQRGFIEVMLTPILRVWKGEDRKKAKEKFTFYTMAEFNAWKTKHPAWRKAWNVKYYKGLGSSDKADIHEDYSALRTFSIATDETSSERLRLAFHALMADQRKEWMKQWSPDLELPVASRVTVTDYIDKALIHYSVVSVQRGLPDFRDGLKESQRKLLAATLKKWPSGTGKEIKVIQLAAYTAETMNYHYGEVSLCGAIVSMTQDFVGANNLRYFKQNGQFGTRKEGGKDASEPRYIFVSPEEWVREIFRDEDDGLLYYIEDEGEVQEPEHYLPILPMWLLNGTSAITTGYRSFIPNHNPVDAVAWIKAKLRGEQPPEILPWYRGFEGTITCRVDPSKRKLQLPLDPDAVIHESGLTSGDGPEWLEAAEDGDDAEVSMVTQGCYNAKLHKGVRITELPIGKWTDTYKKWLAQLQDPQCKCGKGSPTYGHPVDARASRCNACKLQGMVPKDKIRPRIDEYRMCTADPDKVDIFVSGFRDPSPKALGLVKSFGLTTMVMLDEQKLPLRLDSVTQWLDKFYAWRLPFYGKRKALQLRVLQRELQEAEAKCAFIQAVVDGRLVAVNQKRSDVEARCKELALDTRYLSMTLTQQTREEIDAQTQRVLKLQAKISTLSAKTPEQLWSDDLDAFLAVYTKTLMPKPSAESAKPTAGSSKPTAKPSKRARLTS